MESELRFYRVMFWVLFIGLAFSNLLHLLAYLS